VISIFTGKGKLDINAKAAVTGPKRIKRGEAFKLFIGYGADKFGSAKLPDGWGSVISPVRSLFRTAR
jgi:hypothetical protein